MIDPALPRPLRRQRSAPALCALIAIALASCGGDTPGPVGPGVTTRPLYPVGSGTRSHEPLLLRVRADSVPPGSFAGSVGATAISASRLDDTTLVVLTPAVAAGSHRLQLEMSARTYAANIIVLDAPPLPDPDVHFDTTFARIEASMDSLVALVANPLTRPAGIDSASFAADAAGFEASVAELRAAWASASAADRATVSAVLVRNADALGLGRGSASLAGLLFSAGLTEDGCGNIKSFFDRTNREAKQLWGTLAIVGVVSWGGGIGTKLLGTLVNAVIVKKFITAKHGEIWEHLFEPCVSELLEGDEGSFLRMNAIAAPEVFVAGEARKVTIPAEHRSITEADAKLPGFIGEVVTLFRTFQQGWRDLIALIPGYTKPAPELPAQPARRERRVVPGSQLALGTLAPSGVSGIASGATDWMVTLNKSRFGTDLPVTYEVRYTPTGMPAQLVTRSATLRPAVYPLATVAAPSATEVEEDGWVVLAATVRDSSGNVLSGRTLHWRSGNPSIATVDSLTGRVVGVAPGQATIAVRATGTVGDTAHASTPVTVTEAALGNDVTITMSGPTSVTATRSVSGGAKVMRCSFPLTATAVGDGPARWAQARVLIAGLDGKSIDNSDPLHNAADWFGASRIKPGEPQTGPQSWYVATPEQYTPFRIIMELSYQISDPVVNRTAVFTMVCHDGPTEGGGSPGSGGPGGLGFQRNHAIVPLEAPAARARTRAVGGMVRKASVDAKGGAR